MRVGRRLRRRGAGPEDRRASVRDAGQRSEDRVRVHSRRMRAQVQEQRYAHHALHRQAGGRHQVRFEVSDRTPRAQQVPRYDIGYWVIIRLKKRIVTLLFELRSSAHVNPEVCKKLFKIVKNHARA